MGTHLSGPSYIYGNKEEPLETYISLNPKVLGISAKMFGRTLPFLLKVLSVGKALSIQAHPNKVRTTSVAFPPSRNHFNNFRSKNEL